MDDDQNLFLCGGVLFFLLTQTVLRHKNPSQKRLGMTDQQSDKQLMKDLIYTFTGSHNYGVAKDTSEYKECKSEGSINVPFNKLNFAETYHRLVKNHYYVVLKRMKEFTSAHFDPNLAEWFVKIVLEIINRDKTIDDKAEFIVGVNDLTISKEALIQSTEFELEPFLVGILDFILEHRRGKNRRGRVTLEILGDKKPRKARVYNNSFDEIINRQINVGIWDPQESAEDTKKASSDESEKAEIIEPQKRDERSNAKKNQKVINHQTNVVQNGDHNINVTNNGTINMNL